MEIKGKKAVIVGGASGMAKASAELLRQKGADVAILDLPSSAGAAVAKELGGPSTRSTSSTTTRPSPRCRTPWPPWVASTSP